MITATRKPLQREPARPVQSILLPRVGRLLQRKCACGGTPGPTGECEACRKKKRFGLQTKLNVSEQGDIYEQEADRIADQVMATPAHPGAAGAAPRIQRISGQSNGQMDAAPRSVGQALVSPARPLEPALQAEMEFRFAHDFSMVRVHSGGAAERSARDVSADAYTVGQHIVFGAGRFAPGTCEGRRLIAHELTHVVQQAGPGAVSTERSGVSARDAVKNGPASPDVVQRKWRLDSATPSSGVEMDYTDDNGETGGAAQGAKPDSLFGSLSATAVTKQTQGFVKQKIGGKAQIARWMTTHYIFKNDGKDQDFLQLKFYGQFGGNAKAEDLRYARAASAVWGASIERSANNPTPPGKNLFQIKGGAISAATVGDLGEIEADLSLGESGSVKITIPLKKVDQGTFAPFSDAIQPLHDVPATVGEVDVQLGARVEADAEIRDDWFGIAPWISRNWNTAMANALYLLNWQSRPAPGAGARPAAGDDKAEAEAAKQVTASGRCKCVGDEVCGGGKIYDVCFNTQKDCKKAQKDLDDYCNNNEKMKKQCQRPKCYYRHSKPTCPDKCSP